MVSDRQLAANRRNAQKSSGPRSPAGKKRTSHNAYRHGLAAKAGASPDFLHQVERLAREIAEKNDNIVAPSDALTVAESVLTMVRVQRAKLALIQQITLEASPNTNASTLIEASAVVASQDVYSAADKIRRVLVELARLDRYEQRARSRRNRALVKIEKP
jgi:cysteinyl-tRNA synthetase